MVRVFFGCPVALHAMLCVERLLAQDGFLSSVPVLMTEVCELFQALKQLAPVRAVGPVPPLRFCDSPANFCMHCHAENAAVSWFINDKDKEFAKASPYWLLYDHWNDSKEYKEDYESDRSSVAC